MTKRNRLEKAGEETKQMLEEGWKQKCRKFTGATENNKLELWNILIVSNFVTFSHIEKWKLMRGTNDSQPELNQE